jgi:hypothetical protein
MERSQLSEPGTTGGRFEPTAPGRAASLTSLFLVCLLLAACALTMSPQTTHGPTAAPGGLSKDAAITLALREAPASSPAPTVVWASIESNPFYPRGNNPTGPLVWIVRLQGGLSASPCPSGSLDRLPSASDAVCLDQDGGVDVVLDYFSGDLLGWIH